jgi:hypothetical protein
MRVAASACSRSISSDPPFVGEPDAISVRTRITYPDHLQRKSADPRFPAALGNRCRRFSYATFKLRRDGGI